MEQKKNTYSFNAGFAELLALVFIVLKLLGKITWSWLWVLSPIWIPLCIILPLIVIWVYLKNKI